MFLPTYRFVDKGKQVEDLDVHWGADHCPFDVNVNFAMASILEGW